MGLLENKYFCVLSLKFLSARGLRISKIVKIKIQKSFDYNLQVLTFYVQPHIIMSAQISNNFQISGCKTIHTRQA